MRPSDDVFWLTLVDFLTQLCFFGLLCYAVVQVAADSPRKPKLNNDPKPPVVLSDREVEAVQELKTATGVGDFTQLSDQLGTFVHISRVKGLLSLLGQKASTAQGLEDLRTKLQKETFEKEPCLKDAKGNGSRRLVATVIVTDTHITFQRPTPELDELLGLLGKRYKEVESLEHKEFTSQFLAITRMRPDCRYSIGFIERTELIHGRDAIGRVFYHSPVKQ